MGGGGQDKPAWTACPPGVKITKVGGKITRDSLPPGGQAVQGGKINFYTGRKDRTRNGMRMRIQPSYRVWHNSVLRK